MHGVQDDEGEGGEEGRKKRRKKRRRDRSLELDEEDFDLLEEQGVKVRIRLMFRVVVKGSGSRGRIRVSCHRS